MKLDLSFMPPPSHLGCAFSTINADPESFALLKRAKAVVKAFNKTVEPSKRAYLRIMGRLGKNNPAYARYSSNYSWVRVNDATRFDVYFRFFEPQPDRKWRSMHSVQMREHGILLAF